MSGRLTRLALSCLIASLPVRLVAQGAAPPESVLNHVSVIAEAFRVLKPGGRFAVSDVVVKGDDAADPEFHIAAHFRGNVAGALEESAYREKLTRAGFETIDVEP